MFYVGRFKLRRKIFAYFSIFSLLLQVSSGILLYQPVYSEELTPTPTQEVSPTPEITPTSETMPTPTIEVSPNPSVEPVVTSTLEATPTPTPIVSTESPKGSLSATILHDVSAQSLELNLDSQNQASSASLTTDKTDYSPTDTVLISGNGFKNDTVYTLMISSDDPPPVNFQTQITTNDSSSFIYSYQLDGNYRPNYKVEIKDSTGTIIATTTFTDTDNTPPSFDPIADQSVGENSSEQSIPITNVSPGDESDQTVTLTATSSDPSIIPNPTVSGSGATRTLTYTPVINASGSATITVTANDGQVQNNTFSRTFTITVTAVNDPPTITLSSPNGGEVWRGGNIQNISWTATDVDSDTLTITLEYTTDGVSYLPIAAGETNDGSFSWTVLSIDFSTVKVKATVSDGTVTANDSSNANFTIDSTAPTGTISINSGATYTNTTAVTLTFTVSETVAQMELRNGTTGNFQRPITYESPHSYTLPTGGGTKTVAVRFTDSAGNKSVGAINDNIILDTTAPTDPTSVSSTSHIVSEPSADDTIDMALDGASDALSGVDGFAYEFNNDSGWVCDQSKDVEQDTTTVISNPLSDGDWYFHLCTVDNAGNWTSTVDVGPFVIDLTPPDITDPVIDPFNLDVYYISGAVTVSATVTDNVSDVDSVQFTMFDTYGTEESCDGVQDVEPSLWSCEIDTTLLDDSSSQEYDLSVVASDTLGNSTAPGDEVLYSNFDDCFDIDNTAPFDPVSVSSSSHTVDGSSNDTTIDIEWSADADDGGASGVDGFSYSFTQGATDEPDTEKDAEAEDGTTTTTSDVLADASWYFHLRTVDNVGNWTSTVHLGPFIIDTTAPTGSWSSPSSGATVSGAAGLIVSVTDATSGIASVAFSYRLASSNDAFTVLIQILPRPTRCLGYDGFDA